MTQDGFATLMDLFADEPPPRDSTGALAEIAALLEGLEPKLLLLADRDGRVAAHEDFGRSLPTADMALGEEMARHLSFAETAVFAVPGGPGQAFAVRLSTDAAILGGVLDTSADAEPRILPLAAALAVSGGIAWACIRTKSSEEAAQTRVRHLLAERDTLKASHAEVVSRAIEEHQQWLYEQEHRVALEKLYRAAEDASNAKSEFLANMSHELRTPMHGILSFAAFGMKKWETAQREQLRQYFEKVERSGRMLLALINDLLDLSKLEAGRMTYELSRLDLRPLIGEVVDEFSSMVELRRIAIQVAPFDFEAVLVADGGKIGQVVRNLLSNAVKFSPDGGKIEIALERTQRTIRICVADQGLGIPQDELEEIFDKFIQSSKTRSGAGGTGLGLAICRQIVEAHHGRIWADNQPTGGASFSVELPTDLESGSVQKSANVHSAGKTPPSPPNETSDRATAADA
jgi:signal transduction histidine kinase